jgi:hypothetical protein
MLQFSVVLPVSEKDVPLIRKTAHSWFSLASDDFVICVDKPVSDGLEGFIQRCARICKVEHKVRILEVERSSEWSFHQAHVRREGFSRARHEKILTGDIDLVVNANVYKALSLLGENNIGLVSLSKFHHPDSIMDYWREGVLFFLRNVAHGALDPVMATSTFSGLYALFRPYWLDSEPADEAKRLVNPKQFHRGEKPDARRASAITGEDTFLRDHMQQKHRCIYLKTIGAVDLRVSLENLPTIQFAIGQYFARQGRPMLISMGRAVLRAQPYYLKGYLYEKSRNKK